MLLVSNNTIIGPMFKRTLNFLTPIGNAPYTYFIDPKFTKSKKHSFLNPSEAWELQVVLKHFRDNKKSLYDLRFWFNYLTFYNRKGVTTGMIKFILSYRKRLDSKNELPFLFLRYDCEKDRVLMYIQDLTAKSGMVLLDTFSRDKTSSNFNELDLILNNFTAKANCLSDLSTKVK
jgi:hypothetical protein